MGEMADIFKKEIAAFVRELDPLVQWESQPDDSRKGLEDRIYADYHRYGKSSRLQSCGEVPEEGSGSIFTDTQLPSAEVNRRREAQTS